MSAAVRARHFAHARKRWDDASEGCLLGMVLSETLQDPRGRAEAINRLRLHYYAARKQTAIYAAAMTRAFLQRDQEEQDTAESQAERAIRIHWERCG